MGLEELNERERKLRSHIKKHCVLCMGRSRLHTNLSEKAPERTQVQAALKAMYDMYAERFESLRKMNAEGPEILAANNNRRIMLDIIDECKGCDRDSDRANRSLMQVK